MSVQIQLRRGTAANWTASNPTLASGELGLETDTGKIKMGDGSTNWTTLGYFGGAPSGSAGGDLTGTYPNPTIGNDKVTYAKMQNVSATSRFMGRITAAAGDMEELTAANAKTILALVVGDLTAAATSRIFGRITAGSGAGEELTAANVKTILALAQADISGLTTASSPQFTGIELGNASDTTLTRLGAGRMAVEGREVIAWDGVITKAVTESVASSTVLQDDDELFVALTSGKVYWIELFIIYDSPAGGATPDLKVVVGEDATARGVFVADRFAAADAASSGVVAADQTTTSACGTATTARVCKMHGWYVSNGGTFKMQWAQITSGANATRVLAGSFLRYRLVA